MRKIFIVECCPFAEHTLVDAFTRADVREYRRTNPEVDVMIENVPLIFEVAASDKQIRQVQDQAGSISRGYDELMTQVRSEFRYIRL